MIIPVVQMPSLGADGIAPDPDTLVTRLGFLSEVVLSGSGAGGVDVAGYKSFLRACPCRVGPFDVLSADDRDAKTDAIVAWLDAGARRAIISVDVSDPAAVADLAEWSKQLPGCRHRLVAAFRVRDLRAGEAGGGLAGALKRVMDGLRPVVGCVLLDFERGYAVAPQILPELKVLRGKEGWPDYVQIVFARGASGNSTARNLAADDSRWESDEIGRLHLESLVDVQCPATLDLSGGKSGVVEPDPSGPPLPIVDAASAFIACLRTDRPDGLMPTVVCDASGVALGLVLYAVDSLRRCLLTENIAKVYSNSTSIRESLACGRGVYWSRSRGGLWRKGDTSGAWQELRGIAVDCDSDAVKFNVWQHGSPPAFCHLNRRTCWSADSGIGHLERTLVARKEQAPEGSYTKRLFNDPMLLRNKLVEEAQELAEAETKQHVAEEAADVTYFAMVRCAAAGVSFADVERELDKRALKLKRRPGNAKADRIAAGDKILAKERKASEVPNLL